MPLIRSDRRPLFDPMPQGVIYVNPTNLRGPMGAGLASIFAKKYPVMAHTYKYLCEQQHIRYGDIFMWRCGEHIVANVPSKDDWRDPAILDLVKVGLQALDRFALLHYPERTIITSKIGCGLGGLDWENVEPIVKDMRSSIVVSNGQVSPRDIEVVPERTATYRVYRR